MKTNNIEMITIGEELLCGITQDNNFFMLAQEVFAMGLKINYHQCVGDSKADILSALKIANSRSKYVLLTGGLGPTVDDLTREVASEYFGKKLVLNIQIETELKSIFVKRKYTSLNKKQALFPEGSNVIRNPIGTASGFSLTKSSTKFYFLPGVSKEFSPMSRNTFLKDLAREKRKSNLYSFSKTLKIFGLSESEVAEKIKKVNSKNTYIGYRPYRFEVHLRLISTSNKLRDAKRENQNIERKIRKLLGLYIYTDQNLTLAEHVVSMLLKKKLKITIAESCTGGLLSDMITNVPDSSKCFDFGLVTYSNESKNNLLKVKNKTLLIHGAVSKQTVSEMVKNLNDLSNSDMSIAISGIAGPGGGTNDKPVGTVFIGMSKSKNIDVKKYLLYGNRKSIKLRTCLIALDRIRNELIS
tara:strand:+ start:4911 stop:6149 length:1239 start_codon:yes stop_codon:yes gene_type:complete